VTRASTLPTLRESSLTGLSRDCPANAVEAHAVAAAIAAGILCKGMMLKREGEQMNNAR
jgi:hypothetical protein